MAMTGTQSIVRGTNNKPVASQALIEYFSVHGEPDGHLFIGYPIIGSADGRHPIDAVYISMRKGVVVFDLVEGSNYDGFEDRQDEAATRVQQRLFAYKELVRRRQLAVEISTITFAPAVQDRYTFVDEEYVVANQNSLGSALNLLAWNNSSTDLLRRTLSAIQNISTVRRNTATRQIEDRHSRGAKLQQLEAAIATLDNLQSKAVIETVDGVQRIRGLAGSGKTIILALKAAYLHAQHPRWRIAVTFNTRSLKAQFHRLINSFSNEATGEEPNWNNVRVINSWGASGGANREGLFYEFCATNGATYMDFGSASSQYGRDAAFSGACDAALAEVSDPKAIYDAILVDEAQDLPPAFLRMCYAMLDDSRRLVYAYDELQNLSGTAGLPSAAEIFGTDSEGRSLVTFEQSGYDLGARRDIVLEKCYRNSRPVLATAHSLGFGIYRRPTRQATTGLVQMFDQPQLWEDIGYKVVEGELRPGVHVKLERDENSSPGFLESHSDTDDLVQFIKFDTQAEQNEWVVEQIYKNLHEEELSPNDIVVINTDPLRTRSNLGPIRKGLLRLNVPNHLAGVDTVADVFFRPEGDSVTFTGIHRAKGNEAGMVYIVNADECQASVGSLSRVRNRLFTAITRSKAWVRVLGVGDAMEEMIGEYKRIRSENFALSFTYPTVDQRGKIEIIHRDMNEAEAENVAFRQATVTDLLQDLESGRLYREDLDPDLVERLTRLLRDPDAS